MTMISATENNDTLGSNGLMESFAKMVPFVEMVSLHLGIVQITYKGSLTKS